MHTKKDFLPPKKLLQFCYSIIAGLSGLVIGSAVGWNSPVTQLMKIKEIVGINDIDERNRVICWKTAGSYCLGTVVGGLVESSLARLIGYKWSMVVYNLITSVGWLILLLQKDFVESQVVWIGRLVQGIGSGGLGLLTPTYISHITDFDIRGRAQMFHHAYVCFGVYYSYAMGNIVNYTLLNRVCLILPILHIFLVIFLPESPFYSYKRKNCSHEAKTILRRIKGDHYNKYIKKFESKSCKKRVWKILFIGFGLILFQQLCGVSSLIFYMEEILGISRLIDDTSVKTKFITTSVYLMQMILCLISVELIEVLGRKFMLITSSIGMGLCLIALMVFHVYPTKDCLGYTEWNINIYTILVYLYACSYSIGWGPVVMVVYTEIVYFGNWISSLIYACGQFVMFLLVYMFFITNTLKGNTYTLWVFIASCIVSIIFVFFCVPETRAMHLNRIQDMLDNRNQRNDKNVPKDVV